MSAQPEYLIPSDDFEQIVSQHYKPLYRFAVSLTRTEAYACDLTQQTFYIWATKGHQLRDRSKGKSWLFTISVSELLVETPLAFNAVLDYRRDPRLGLLELCQVGAFLRPAPVVAVALGAVHQKQIVTTLTTDGSFLDTTEATAGFQSKRVPRPKDP
jgi:hypothetical protein